MNQIEARPLQIEGRVLQIEPRVLQIEARLLQIDAFSNCIDAFSINWNQASHAAIARRIKMKLSSFTLWLL